VKSELHLLKEIKKIPKRKKIYQLLMRNNMKPISVMEENNIIK